MVALPMLRAGGLVLILVGACGRIDFKEYEDPPAPAIATVTPRATIAIGVAHGCALTDQGSLYCWGGNYTGELGVGDYTQRSSPIMAGAPTAWRRIVTGDFHT